MTNCMYIFLHSDTYMQSMNTLSLITYMLETNVILYGSFFKVSDISQNVQHKCTTGFSMTVSFVENT